MDYVEGNAIIEKLNLSKYIDLKCSYIDGIKLTPKQLGLLCGALSQKKNLEFLELSDIVQKKEFYKHIGGMLKDTASIQTLILYNNMIYDKGMTCILEDLTLNHTLLHLNIGINKYIYIYYRKLCDTSRREVYRGVPGY